MDDSITDDAMQLHRRSHKHLVPEQSRLASDFPNLAIRKVQVGGCNEPVTFRKVSWEYNGENSVWSVVGMMRRHRLPEEPRGRGKVCDGSEEIAEVGYRLSIAQDVHVHQGMVSSEPQEVLGLETVQGNLTVLRGSQNLVGNKVLILHLEDGREWESYALGENPLGTLQAKSASGKPLSKGPAGGSDAWSGTPGAPPRRDPGCR